MPSRFGAAGLATFGRSEQYQTCFKLFILRMPEMLGGDWRGGRVYGGFCARVALMVRVYIAVVIADLTTQSSRSSACLCQSMSAFQ